MSGARGDAETLRVEIREALRKIESFISKAIFSETREAAFAHRDSAVVLIEQRGEMQARLALLELQRSTVCAPSMAQLTAEDAAVSQAVFSSVVGTFKAMSPKAALAALASLSVVVELRGRVEPGFLNVLLDEMRADVEERLIERAAGKIQTTNN